MPEGVREEHWRREVSVLQHQQGAFRETKVLSCALGQKLAVSMRIFPQTKVSSDINLKIDILQGVREGQTQNNQ